MVLPANGKIRSDGIKLLLGVLDLEPEAVDDAKAPVDRVLVAYIGLSHNRLHRHQLLVWIHLLQDLQNVADPEEPVRVLELLWLVRGEVRRERAI